MYVHFVPIRWRRWRHTRGSSCIRTWAFGRIMLYSGPGLPRDLMVLYIVASHVYYNYLSFAFVYIVIILERTCAFLKKKHVVDGYSRAVIAIIHIFVIFWNAYGISYNVHCCTGTYAKRYGNSVIANVINRSLFFWAAAARLLRWNCTRLRAYTREELEFRRARINAKAMYIVIIINWA